MLLGLASIARCRAKYRHNAFENYHGTDDSHPTIFRHAIFQHAIFQHAIFPHAIFQHAIFHCTVAWYRVIGGHAPA